MKEKKTKETKPVLVDLTKVSNKLLDKEVNRREGIRQQKEHEETMVKMYKLYQRRSSCPLLHGAYLPDGYHTSYWQGLDVLKEFKIASIQLGEHRGSKHSEIKMYTTKPTYEALRTMIHEWDSEIRTFWKETGDKFETLILRLVKDPARLAIMIADASDGFSIDVENSTAKEVKYYNKIIDIFNTSVVERFSEFTDDILVDALKRLQDGKVRPGSFGDREDAEDVLMSVLKLRGQTHTLNRERRLKEDMEYEAAEDDEEDDTEDDWI